MRNIPGPSARIRSTQIVFSAQDIDVRLVNSGLQQCLDRGTSTLWIGLFQPPCSSGS
jgi:hypothetical protein